MQGFQLRSKRTMAMITLVAFGTSACGDASRLIEPVLEVQQQQVLAVITSADDGDDVGTQCSADYCLEPIEIVVPPTPVPCTEGWVPDEHGACWSDGGGGGGGGGGETPPGGGGGGGGQTIEDELLEEFGGPIVGAVVCLVSIGLIGMEARGVAIAYRSIVQAADALREGERVLEMLNQQPNPDHQMIVSQQNHVEQLRSAYRSAVDGLADRLGSGYVNSIAAVIGCGAAFGLPTP
jgi:hypothetical protein